MLDDERLHNKRIVVSAAIRCEKIGAVFCGVRHGDPFMISQMTAVVSGNLGVDEYTSKQWHEILGHQEQGFIDNRYNFLTREEAMVIAKEVGQDVCVRGCGGSTEKLYSEGLY